MVSFVQGEGEREGGGMGRREGGGGWGGGRGDRSWRVRGREEGGMRKREDKYHG